MAAPRFVNSSSDADSALAGTASAAAPPVFVGSDAAGTVWSTASTAAAFLFAWLALWCDRLPAWLHRPCAGAARTPIQLLRAVHSGDIRDYVAWITFGTAALGGLLALSVR